MVVGGEPGIGKSRLAEELASRAADSGAEVLWGRCWEAEGAPPYWPWVQALRSCVRGRGPEQLRARARQRVPPTSPSSSPTCASSCRICGVPSGRADPQQARFRLFDSIAHFLTDASRSRPLVLVLDDLNWADTGSLLLLEFVARELAETRTCCWSAPTATSSSRAATHSLRRSASSPASGPFERVVLRGISHEDVERFIEATCGFEPDPALVRAVHAQTEGNPFFVGEVVRLLDEEGALTSAAPGTPERWSARIPDGVREAIGRRLDRLSRPCNETLTVASVIGREFGLDQLARLVDDLSEDGLLEVLDEALAARVIEELPRGRRPLSVHARVDPGHTGRRPLAHTPGAPPRPHRGGARGAVRRPRPTSHAAELAHHFGEAEVVVGSEKLVRYCADRGRVRTRCATPPSRHSPTSSARSLRRAPRRPPTRLPSSCSASAARSWRRSGTASSWSRRSPACVRAFDLYVESGDVGRAVAVAAYPLPLSLRFGYTDSAELIARALSLVQPDTHEAGASARPARLVHRVHRGRLRRSATRLPAGAVDRRA